MHPVMCDIDWDDIDVFPLIGSEISVLPFVTDVVMINVYQDGAL